MFYKMETVQCAYCISPKSPRIERSWLCNLEFNTFLIPFNKIAANSILFLKLNQIFVLCQLNINIGTYYILVFSYNIRITLYMNQNDRGYYISFSSSYINLQQRGQSPPSLGVGNSSNPQRPFDFYKGIFKSWERLQFWRFFVNFTFYDWMAQVLCLVRWTDFFDFIFFRVIFFEFYVIF